MKIIQALIISTTFLIAPNIANAEEQNELNEEQNIPIIIEEILNESNLDSDDISNDNNTYIQPEIDVIEENKEESIVEVENKELIVEDNGIDKYKHISYNGKYLFNYFTKVEWIVRNGVTSLSLTPVTDGTFKRFRVNMDAITNSFELLKLTYAKDYRWNNRTETLYGQYLCHAVFAGTNKVPWNIEPARFVVSESQMIDASCNPTIDGNYVNPEPTDIVEDDIIEDDIIEDDIVEDETENNGETEDAKKEPKPEDSIIDETKKKDDSNVETDKKDEEQIEIDENLNIVKIDEDTLLGGQTVSVTNKTKNSTNNSPNIIVANTDVVDEVIVEKTTESYLPQANTDTNNIYYLLAIISILSALLITVYRKQKNNIN